jgi:anaerobic selenocysteine-containing dehydrogenase
MEEGLEDEDWLHQFTLGWPAFKERINEFPSKRVANITGLSLDTIQQLAERYATKKPGLIKFGDGLNRNLNGGQAVRALLSLPALTGQYGKSGGGVAYSTSDLFTWDHEAVNKWSECPQPGRLVNMNRLGAALMGEVEEPPLKSLFVFAANPAASTANASMIVDGLKREDLFTVVHELYMTDTVDYADIVLPATSQLEQIDLHNGYGHSYLTYNERAVEPLAECKSNWEVMRLLAAGMNYDDLWLKQSADEVIGEILEASVAHEPALAGITLEKLRKHGTLSVSVKPGPPFEDGRFPTPSGKLELYSEWLAGQGIDPLPGYNPKAIDDGGYDLDERLQGRAGPLMLVSGAAHHFVSSSLANQDHHQKREGQPTLQLHSHDAAERNIKNGDLVLIENGRGAVTILASVTDSVRPGVVASPKGYWPKLTGGKNLNWLTSDILADMAGQSSYHSTMVWVSPAH